MSFATDEIKAKTVITVLNDMFKKQWYDICELDKCLAITGAPKNQDYNVLRAYHCKQFDTLDSETKKFLYAATVGMVTAAPEFPIIQLAEPKPVVDKTVIEFPKQENLIRKALSMLK